MQAYLDEFTDRYNKKKLTNSERFELNVKRADTARLTYKQVIWKKKRVKEYLASKRATFE